MTPTKKICSSATKNRLVRVRLYTAGCFNRPASCPWGRCFESCCGTCFFLPWATNGWFVYIGIGIWNCPRHYKSYVILKENEIWKFEVISPKKTDFLSVNHSMIFCQFQLKVESQSHSGLNFFFHALILQLLKLCV